MRAGSLKHLIRFEREVVIGDDGYGNERKGWEEIATVYAALNVQRGYEEARAMSQEGRVLYRARIRAQSKTRQIDNRSRAILMRTGDAYDVHAAYPIDDMSRVIEVIMERGAHS